LYTIIFDSTTVEAITHPNPIIWTTIRLTMAKVRASVDTVMGEIVHAGKRLMAGASKSGLNFVFMMMEDPETRVNSMFETKNRTVSAATHIIGIGTMTSIDGNEGVIQSISR